MLANLLGGSEVINARLLGPGRSSSLIMQAFDLEGAETSSVAWGAQVGTGALGTDNLGTQVPALLPTAA